MVTVVFHTTSLRGSDYEIRLDVPFLKEGAFLAQSVATYQITRAIRKLGGLTDEQLTAVQNGVFSWLGK